MTNSLPAGGSAKEGIVAPKTRAQQAAKAVMLSLAFLVMPFFANAQSWNLGLTVYGEADHGPQAELLIERQFRPFADLGKWSIAPGVGARISQNTGSWIGGGVIAYRTYGEFWRVDAGLMPGYYSDGSEGKMLGSDLEFRSYLSVGRQVSDSLYIAVGIEHMSNGGIGDYNPGDNRLMVRLIKLDR